MVTKSVDPNQHTFRSSELQSVVDQAIQFFINTPVHELPPPSQFIGSGVYAIYYSGGCEVYRKIAQRNKSNLCLPIYVGKAVAPGWRTGRSRLSRTPDLYHRLYEHSKSIQQTSNLLSGDFRCRFMILSGIEGDIVVPVEAELIRRHKPLWNTVVDGFGNHDPGSGRYEQSKSEWDALHPGRSWTENLRGKSPGLKIILRKIGDYLRGLPLS